jgi:heme oxygenase (biliverdin-IX-beta and delta-forming)
LHPEKKCQAVIDQTTVAATTEATPMSELRSATWPSHQRLEKRLDIKARFSDVSKYRGHLSQMWGFCAPLEQWLMQIGFAEVLRDYVSRLKLPLLGEDLIALGCDPGAIARLPKAVLVPTADDTAAAFGCAYVLEGATLGGRTLLPMIQTRLGFSALNGAKFMASYGEEVATKWHSFGNALNAWCGNPERRASASRAAVATFDSLDRWLCEVPA